MAVRARTLLLNQFGSASGAGLTTGALPVAAGPQSLTDSNLFYTSPDTIEERNGTNPQKFYSYNTYTSATAYERTTFIWQSNIFDITAQAAGGGTARNIRLMSSWVFDASTGYFYPNSDNNRDFGSTSARIGNIFVGTSVNLNVAGAGLLVKQGTNATFGVFTLSGGNASQNISTTKATATAGIFVSVTSAGGTRGSVAVTTRTNGVGFTVASTSATETSSGVWLIVEAA